MPFEVLETVTKGNEPPSAKVSYMRPGRRKDGDFDRDKLRISGLPKGAAGGAKAKTFKSHVIMRFGHVPRFGDEIFDGVRCAIARIDDHTYDVTLPEELRNLGAPSASVSNIKRTA